MSCTMTISHVREPQTFGKRKEPHSIVITRNGQSRHFSINPLYFSVLVGFVAMFSVGYFAATTYLVLRDDLIGSRGARDARVIQEYEDRISALRTSLDRVTSRQLLDQQAIESKVADLIEKQKKLGDRDPALQALFKKAREFGLDQAESRIDAITTGTISSKKQSSISSAFGNGFALRGLGEKQNLALSQVQKFKPLQRVEVASNEFSYRADSPLFSNMAQSMVNIDRQQKNLISDLHTSANEKLTTIAKLMKRVGFDLPGKIQAKISGNYDSQIGGPFEPLDSSYDFPTLVRALDYSLEALQTAQQKVAKLPVAAPTSSRSYSSKFGPRVDPFKRTYAMHTGLDIRGKYGDSVRATGKGKVVYAGLKGGYGKFVEIDHGNGLITRYAHMNAILVKKGQQVDVGFQIGEVGSTGRSTGPHLHYEVRLNNKPVNPQKYMGVGKKLAALL